MKPEDVPAEWVEKANEAWRTAPQKRDGQPTRMRHALASVWPAIEAMVRARVAAEIEAEASSLEARCRKGGGAWTRRAARIARGETDA